MLINIYEKSGYLMYVMNHMIYRIKITSLSKLSRCGWMILKRKITQKVYVWHLHGYIGTCILLCKRWYNLAANLNKADRIRTGQA